VLREVEDAENVRSVPEFSEISGSSEGFVRWILDEEEFDSIFLEAQECIFVDSRRVRTELKCLNFADLEICTSFFASLILKLMDWGGDETAYYVVLRPDPVLYFYKNFNRYPVLEIGKTDTAESYLAALNEDPGGSPSDAIGSHWWTCVIAPHSLRWFVHVMRDDTDDTGHLWVPREWVQPLIELHPGLRLNTF